MGRFIYIVAIMLAGIFKLSAQQNPQFSQYLFNGVVINPAYAGSKEFVNVNAFYRKQWVGLENSPATQTVSVDGPFVLENSAFGAFFTNDYLGFQSNRSLYGSFAYRIALSENTRLALGVAAGISQYVIEGEKLTTYEPNDPRVPEEYTSTWTPDARAGLYFHTPSFFAGVSVWELISSVTVDNPYIYNPVPHVYFSTGFAVPISNALVIRPSLLIKEDFKAPTDADITAFLIFRERIWAGSSYRTRVFKKPGTMEPVAIKAKNAVALMVQVFPTRQFRIGYGYDFSVTEFHNYSTHEISVGYYFLPRINAGMLTPRYF